MKRRSFLRLTALSGLAATAGEPLRALAPTAGEPPVHTVLLVAKCHLDVGFTQTQRDVMRKYFDVYFPQAMSTAARLRESGTDRYCWTTGAWLLYEYLEQASPAQHSAVERALAAGDLSWHALPFSWQTEMMPRSMIEGGLGFSKELDRRFGRTTISAKMTDVPGHTRGLVAPLAAAGVRLLDIGVNAASTPPDVPELFVWKDPDGSTLPVMYHRHDYGSVVVLPGAGVAVNVEVRNDNSGPHTPAEIAAIYTKLRRQFPGATIQATGLNEVATAVDTIRDRLPVVTTEIGDTWIYGCASDPEEVARYREMVRLREQWLAAGTLRVGDKTDRAMLRRLLLSVEHTWGTDTKSYLDNDHYRPRELAAVLARPGYRTMQHSWQEKRDDLDESIAGLPSPLQQQAHARLSSLVTARSETAGLVPFDPATRLTTRHFEIALDPNTGALQRLRHLATGREWASPAQPLALFTYQTLSPGEYASFLDRYIKTTADWAPRDFGKPGIERFGAAAREWHPRMRQCRHRRDDHGEHWVLDLTIEDSAALATGNVAWPRELVLEITLPDEAPRVDLRLLTLGKTINRMPEAMWLSFAPPLAARSEVVLTKSSQTVRAENVVRGGGRGMHAVDETLRWQYTQSSQTTGAIQQTPRGELTLRTFDAPVVAIGRRSPLNFTLDLPDLSGGAHVCLYNNAWGTNYPQWAGGDWQYRFSLEI